MVVNMNKDKIALIVTAVLLGIGFMILIIIILARSSSSTEQTKELPIITNRPANSTINYENGTQSRLLETLTGERKLTDEDLLAREKITSSIPEKSGTLLTTPNVRLDYLATPDFFQAEILSANVTLAKKEAVDWILSQGISSSGICDLPIMFYLGQIPADELIKSRQTFSPLAPGC